MFFWGEVEGEMVLFWKDLREEAVLGGRGLEDFKVLDGVRGVEEVFAEIGWDA